MPVTVTTTPELLAALKAAKGGETLSLAPGDYAACELNWMAPASEVVIAAADPVNPPVFIGGLALGNCKNLTLRDLTFLPEAKTLNGLVVLKSQDIIIDRCLSRGPSDVRPYTHGNAFFIRASQRVAATSCEARWQYHGLGHMDCDGLTVTGGHFHHLQSDGVRGGGTNDLVIAGNYVSDLMIEPKDHGDGIQVWTTNVKRVTERVVIADNLIERGDGSIVQGVFVRDQAGAGYDDVKITGNAVVGMYYNAIFFQGLRKRPDGTPATPSTNIIVDDNLALGVEGQEGRFRLQGITSGHYGRNVYGMLQLLDNGPDLIVGDGNTLLPKVPSPTALQDWQRRNEPAPPVIDPRDARIAELEARIAAAVAALAG